MDNSKEISSGNSINFDESTKSYAHSSGDQKSQTTPTGACKYDGAQLIIANISPLRPRSEAGKHLSSIFGRFDIDKGNPLHPLKTKFCSEPMIVRRIQKLKS